MDDATMCMTELGNGFPVRALHLLTRALPSPLNDRAYYRLLRGFLRAQRKPAGTLIPIRFGSVEISAPVDHPAVYWRLLPKFNQNQLRVAQFTLRARRGLVIDVGANIGDGVALLRGAGVDAPILAIEGADIWFNILKRNTCKMRGVIVEQAFLGSGELEDCLAPEIRDGTSKLVKDDRGVQVTTLDNLLESHQEGPVALLKTDTDGFDARILFGARKLLTTQAPVLFVEIDNWLLGAQGNSAKQLFGYLLECGYACAAVWDNYGNWITWRPIQEGFSDLIDRYPGGPNAPYLDAAFFSERDRAILDALAGC
jgi:FkbM family methyltransferase